MLHNARIDAIAKTGEEDALTRSEVSDANAAIVRKTIAVFCADGAHEHLALWNFKFGAGGFNELENGMASAIAVSSCITGSYIPQD